jgi:hypothetical protein
MVPSIKEGSTMFSRVPDKGRAVAVQWLLDIWQGSCWEKYIKIKAYS